MTTRPIGDYALLSDGQGAALVSGAGSVDWLCLPRFDSPALCARLLGVDAGHWSIMPAADAETWRRYVPGSMVLETQFETSHGMAMLTDALVFGTSTREHSIGENVPHVLVRVAEVTQGSIAFEVDFQPRPEYGLVRPRLWAIDGGVVASGGAATVVLAGPPPQELTRDRARWFVELDRGDRVVFALQYGSASRATPVPLSARHARRHLADTAKAWQSWSELHERYDGPWRDLVHHSGRVLRALTYQPSGAIVAAPTTSLPEEIGGSRNWDYRYSWVRDASLTLHALWVAACPEEAGRFVDWMVRTVGSAVTVDRKLQIMYGIGGEHDLTERELPHLEGWRESRPVRVGNAAWRQPQIDLFGELLDAVYRLRSTIDELDADVGGFLADLADLAAESWRQPDCGIWEMRGGDQHFLYSKLMCWVALDRAVHLAQWLGTPDRAAHWQDVSAEIRAEILERGWNERVGAYTQAFGSDELDASALMLVISGFLPATDARMHATIERIATDLSAPCGLLYRYRTADGVPGGEATFILCTFWLVECYAQLGRLEQARDLFERATAYANDVGLMSEEAEPITGELLGNFPQALSHIGLVNAAWAITQAEVQPSSGSKR